jgi:hypothetical protein
MRSDDLRRALYMTFDGSDPDAEVARRRVEQRVHRQRQRVASVAALLVVLIAGAVVIGVAGVGRDDKVGVATEPVPHDKLVALDHVRRADAHITAPVNAPLTALQGIELAMERASSVERYARVPLTAARCSNRQEWFVDLARDTDVAVLGSRLGAGVEADVRWRTNDTTSLVRSSMLAFVGGGEHRGDLEAFMKVNATARQIRSVRTALAGQPAVTSVRYLDKTAAYAEFKRIFRDSPDLVRNVSPAALPVSFRVDVAHVSDRPTVQASLEVLPGVDAVIERDPMLETVQRLSGDPAARAMSPAVPKRCAGRSR